MSIEGVHTKEIPSAFQSSEHIRDEPVVIINVEESMNEGREKEEAQFHCWNALGVLYVGTEAKKTGRRVIIHEENVEGYADLEKLITPGCDVGLSGLVTGIERLIRLARQAKVLGARHVFAGGAAVIFGAKEILSLSDCPIDAVFTGSTLTPIREFFEQIEIKNISELQIPGVVVMPPTENRSNEADVLASEKKIRIELARRGEYNPRDFFTVPDLNLYSREYWEKVWANWRLTFGKTLSHSENIRPATALFAQGCTRAAEGVACSYCSIPDVAHIALPSREYLKELLETYKNFGINYVFNVTDSSFEMEHLLNQLESLNAHFSEGLVMYGRAHGIANNPKLLRRWRALVGENGKLVLNVGMDSGNAQMLGNINKVSVKNDSMNGAAMLRDNYEAIDAIAAEEGVFLHLSLVCGNPGESKKTWGDSLALLDYARTKLGRRLLQAESDKFWVNKGSAAAAVLHDYTEAARLAGLAGKTISRNEWERDFHPYKDALSVPRAVLEAWHLYFTHITLEESERYVDEMAELTKTFGDTAPSRHNAFRPG